MATKPTTAPTLDGFAAQLAGGPLADTPRGGSEFGFSGVNRGGSSDTGQPDEQNQFAGLGPVLEDDDADVFKQTDGLVKRQELLVLNHTAQDLYYTTLVSGYPWATLTHDTTKDVWTCTMPYGTTGTTIQAVPNKNLDLVNKAKSTVLADFPEADAEPIDDSEEAEAAAEMANRFLAENAGEQGTNDAVLFDDRVARALVTASSYIEGWVDPSGGGYVPLQIKAHPQAVDANNPLVDAQGNPTTDYILRYVTQDGQFTDDASQAAPQWQPKIMHSKWDRVHVRVFPEDRPVSEAEKVIIVGYSSIAEGKRRWPEIAQMESADLNALCDWTPIRYLTLLPSFQRARWKQTDGREKEKAGASDERLFFYYHILQRATPDYPKGADVVVTGAFGGKVLSRDLLAAEVEVNKGQAKTKELRCREIPLVQITPRGDAHGRDPSGLSFLEQFVGATENNATLAMGFAENVDKTNHTPFAIPSTSPIEGWQVDEARATGDFLLLTGGAEDKPTPLTPPPLATAAFVQMYQMSDEAVNSIASQERAAQGNETSKERSGKALEIAIGRNNIANTPMQNAVNNAVARWNRIKLELAMQYFTTPQLVKYVGEDGAYKQDEFTGVDFALVGKVSIKAGTGTMMPPAEKVNYLGQLKANGMLSEEDAKKAARPAFAKQLGLPPNGHEQYVKRCVDSWLKGPPQDDPNAPADPMTGQPKPGWVEQYQAWMQAQQQYEMAQAQFQQQTQAQQQYFAAKAKMLAGPPSGAVGPAGQVETAGTDYEQASIAVSMAEMQNPAIGQPLQPPQPPQVPKPWTPFSPRPNDTEPGIAAVWMVQLSDAMSSVTYDEFGPEWQDVLNRQYGTVRQAVAIGSGAGAQITTPQAGQSVPHAAAPTGQRPKAPQQPQQPTQATPTVRGQAA